MTPFRVLLALPCVLLAACQMTTFERSPLAADANCDPALVGRWESVDDDADGTAAGRAATPPEVVLIVDAACRLEVEENERGGVRRGDSTPVTLARHGAHRYASVDAGWLMTRFREDHRFPEGDVVLLRFAIDGDALTVWNTDDKAVAHAIIDGALTGEVQYTDSELYNRLSGAQPPAVLDRADLFDAEAARFRRAAED